MPDYIDPMVGIPAAIVFWLAFWLVDTAEARRAKRRDEG